MKIKSPDISSQNFKNLNIKDKKETDGSGISKNFQSLLNEVNKQQHYAENKQVDLLTSNNKDIHKSLCFQIKQIIKENDIYPFDY